MKATNILGIDTKYGYRTVELFEGDLTKLGFAADVLVMSAFAGSYVPSRGTLIRAVESAYGTKVQDLAERPWMDLRQPLGVWISGRLPDNVPFRRYLCVELRGTRFSTAEALDNVFAALLVLEAKQEPVPSVALPLLGAGSQGLPAAEIAGELVPRARTYLERSTSTQRLIFAEMSPTRAALVSAGLDQVLGRDKVILPQQQLTEALRNDVVNKLQHSGTLFEPDCKHVQLDWLRLLQQPEVRSVEIGVQSRKLVELFVSKLQAAPGPLANRIRDLELRGVVAPWVCAYMHVLRQIGNEAAHENVSGATRLPPVLAPPDLIAGLFCVQRLLDAWNSFFKEA